MIDERNRLLRSVTLETRDEVGVLPLESRGVHDVRFDSFPVENGFQVSRGGQLISRWIRRVDPQVLGEYGLSFLRESVPVELLRLTGRGGGGDGDRRGEPDWLESFHRSLDFVVE